jgi:hypothetical protein
VERDEHVPDAAPELDVVVAGVAAADV